ncbi:NADPH-dependent FMN reductase [Chitinophaga sp. GbtcB8]|uniref:NADPH-dependent FMN reductase n=1 Tax=Chitinophaga sp. GbtcB8 TaxID=2824753 RepID=UPI001C30F64F|nr:NAD(P)H-dependent oxidoreductase [Chitinophaga sp. GbtcB8]
MEVSILLGSIREERKSHRLAYYLKDQMIAKGVSVNLIDLKNYSLPVFGSVISNEEKKRVEEISTFLKSAQAVVIVTPEYLSNIPAALKNALEYCGLNLISKVTGIASASASKFGGLHASSNMQITLLNLGAYPAPRRLLVPEIHFAFNQDNEPVQNEMKEQVERFISELLSYADLLENKVAKSSNISS